MNKKKVLFITTFPPNNLTAGQSNTNTVIDDLYSKNYDIDIITFSFSNHTLDRQYRFGKIQIINNKRVTKYLYTFFLFFFFPFYTTRFSFRILFFLLNKRNSYDAIYLDYSQVFIYSMFIKSKNKLFLMTHDLVIQRFKRASKKKWYSKILLPYIFFSEKYFFQKGGEIIFPSYKDKRLAKIIYNVEGIAILPKNRFKTPKQINSRHELNMFVFLGTWNRKENIDGLEWFIDRVYPLLDHAPKFIIIGGNLPPYIINRLPSSFHATGFVEDFTCYLQKASALISPLFLGAGIKFKVLDALSNGCRVIGTPVSFEGITLNDRNNMLQALLPEEFVSSIRYCMENEFDSKKIVEEFENYLTDFKDVTDLI